MENTFSIEDFPIDQGISSLEENAGLEEGFFKNLYTEDDWSFIIKLHAFFETICTHFLCFHFNDKRLYPIFSRLELSNNSTGKIAFLRNLELITKETKTFICTLSEFRNDLVHNVQNTSFNLNLYVSSLDKNELKNKAKALSPYETMLRGISEISKDLPNIEGIKEQTKIENIKKRLLDNPKQFLWISAHNVLVGFVDKYSYSDYLQWEKARQFLDKGNA